MRTLRTAVVLAGLLPSIMGVAPGQQATLARHEGYADPTSEGFRANIGFGVPLIGTVTNDLGFDAWLTQVASSSIKYERTLPNFAETGWALNVRVRILSPSRAPFSAAMANGVERFALYFGAEPDGDQIVSGSGFSPLVLEGSGSTYLDYSLVFDPVDRTADLWVNGTKRLTDIHGGVGAQSAFLSWGGAWQNTTDLEAHWNLVALKTPEPAPLSLFTLGLMAWLAKTRARGVRSNS